MKTTHSPEPWQPRHGFTPSHINLADANGAVIGSLAPGDARRTVAVVNACQGIPDPEAAIAAARGALQSAIRFADKVPINPLLQSRVARIEADTYRAALALLTPTAPDA